MNLLLPGNITLITFTLHLILWSIALYFTWKSKSHTALKMLLLVVSFFIPIVFSSVIIIIAIIRKLLDRIVKTQFNNGQLLTRKKESKFYWQNLGELTACLKVCTQINPTSFLQFFHPDGHLLKRIVSISYHLTEYRFFDKNEEEIKLFS